MRATRTKEYMMVRAVNRVKGEDDITDPSGSKIGVERIKGPIGSIDLCQEGVEGLRILVVQIVQKVQKAQSPTLRIYKVQLIVPPQEWLKIMMKKGEPRDGI